MKLTRREWAGLVAAAPVAAGAARQTSGESPDQLLHDATEHVRKNADAIRKVRVPIGTEPAFLFRAQ